MRILIIEDEKDLADMVRRAMLQDSHAVDVAHNGRTGEEMALSETYDLIILDIMLPGKDGLAVSRELRKQGLQTPILLLTARDNVTDRVKGLDAGADDYLGKPFALAELCARVRALLRRQSQAKSCVLTLGELEMDTATHEVRWGETRVELTSREHAILEYLLRNKGRLLTKGMIAEHVWDYHFNSDFNLIEVYIRRLRSKLEQRGRPRLIYTVRHSGYVIREPDA
ncbi:response regulator transcription factor [bacterium]|nr:MAG: DNA-binding response regulator [candidate division KSB1 bacterium]MCE7940550.1 DNA-binding response regulator [Chlorobi bacterium CHB1]MCL4703511.1 response regulator transcription factor [bacterium]MBC6948895.1 DNA-binding response regulator [candidate division KSB1 bacterium]NUM74331.1 response regulator transcription factor [candidate division KSB1 bacterium]